MIIGICGKSGSGKSTIASILVNNHGNAVHLDIDKVGHNVLTILEVQNELISSFGNSIINNDKVDRKILGDLVFTSRANMDKLTDITWKYMQIEIDKFISINQDKMIILDWILLPITKYFNMCNIKILMDIPYDIRKQRAMLRDNISEDKFNLREQASIEYDVNNFDIVVNNNDIEKIRKLVMKI